MQPEKGDLSDYVILKANCWHIKKQIYWQHQGEAKDKNSAKIF